MVSDEIEDWIMRCGLGDRQAFDRLYAATSAQLFGLCVRILKDRAFAEDALQEAFVRIWQRSGSYVQTGTSPMGWLVTVTRNVAIDRLRAEKGKGGETSLILDMIEAPDPNPEDVALARSEAQRITACFGELSADHADAVRGAYLDGQSYGDLAARFDVPLNTMRSWLRRGLLALKECLKR